MPTDAASRQRSPRLPLIGRNVPVAVGWRLPTAIALIVLLALLPTVASNYWLRLLTTGIMFAGLAHALNLMVGLAGLPALGNVVFFGIGAYGTAILSTRFEAAAPLAIAGGAAVAAATALTASRAMLSLRGSYFLMASVALNFAALEVAVVARGLTNGPQGMTLDPLVTGSPEVVYRTFYYLLVAAVGFSAVTLLVIRRSRFGYGLLAIKGNEDAALMLGVPVFRYKALAWAASAGISGVIGGIYAYWIGYIDPGAVFDLGISLEVFLMVLLGGRFLVAGPLIGALAYETIAIFAWARFQEARLAVLGGLLVVLVMFLPGGLPDVGDRLRRLVGRSAESRHAP